jgi:adenylate kinase
MILILLGPPGAGKGTQAKLLSADLRVPHISTGDMFRDHAARGTELGKRVKAIMASGGLVTDDVTNEMVKERLSRPDVAAGFILDGYPRTTPQAEYLQELLAASGRAVTKAISYEVPEELVVERISGRRSCPTCGAVYHVSANPPKNSGYCDKDDASLVQREDDKPDQVRERLRVYARDTAPLRTFYASRGVLAEVDGVGTPEGILAATKKALPPAAGPVPR